MVASQRDSQNYQYFRRLRNLVQESVLHTLLNNNALQVLEFFFFQDTLQKNCFFISSVQSGAK